jgi:predicted permease
LWISLVRVIVSPLLAILAARWLVLSPAYSISLVISFSLPTAKMAFGVAEKFGEYEEQMAEIIALTTLSMVVVFPLFLFICEHLWPGVIGRAATS